MKTVKCEKCGNVYELNERDYRELDIVGKSVFECEKCGILNTICEDIEDGKQVLFIK